MGEIASKSFLDPLFHRADRAGPAEPGIDSRKTHEIVTTTTTSTQLGPAGQGTQNASGKGCLKSTFGPPDSPTTTPCTLSLSVRLVSGAQSVSNPPLRGGGTSAQFGVLFENFKTTFLLTHVQ